MGRIKTAMVKRAALQLSDSFDGFVPSFDENKKILKNTMPSKKIRNKVAGYLSRLALQKKQKRRVVKVSVESSE